LTDYGQRQIEALAWRMRRLPFNVILISETERTRAVAERLQVQRPSAVVEEAPAWNELHHGRWEGLTYREVQKRFPGEAPLRFAQGSDGRASGGESLGEVTNRIAVAWADLRRRYVGGRVLVVTHATPVQLVLCAITGLPATEHWRWRIDLGSITCLDIYESTTIVRMVNEVPRLRPSGETEAG
jgi:2,3-bisphosphoglycerate-dependent phosphoglycerate mutase/probable phosphoglycerate mutase